ncbi:MAG: hypothetical protein JWM44_2307 [Bacilli bacterium]|nr:hypothetical protein [Bacilli bacterium]
MTKTESKIINRTVELLEGLNGDPEIDNRTAEDILLFAIEQLTDCYTVTQAFSRARTRVGFLV